MAAVYGLAVHGGAFRREKDYEPHKKFIKHVLEQGHRSLAAGAAALDVVTEAARLLEDSGLYEAGKGAAPNLAGYYELDASLMDGATGRAGAVAALRRFRNPILGARAVMDKSEQVLLVSAGAENFLLRQGFTPLDDPDAYFVPANPLPPPVPEKPDHGTVGAVALDVDGRLAAATSTGGVTGKPEGRVGDSPLIGAATWADRRIAVGTTGRGEFFIRAAAAHDVAARCHYKGLKPAAAIAEVLQYIKDIGGSGGIMSMTVDGTADFGFNTPGMHRGRIGPDGVAWAENY